MQQLELFQQFERMTRHPLPLLSLCQDVNSDLKSNGLIAKAPGIIFYGCCHKQDGLVDGTRTKIFYGCLVENQEISADETKSVLKSSGINKCCLATVVVYMRTISEAACITGAYFLHYELFWLAYLPADFLAGTSWCDSYYHYYLTS